MQTLTDFESGDKLPKKGVESGNSSKKYFLNCDFHCVKIAHSITDIVRCRLF